MAKFLSDPDPVKKQKATHAMTKMKKIYIAELEQAANS